MDTSLISEVPKDLFTDLEQIGSGSNSDIFKATHVPTQIKVALKISIKNPDDKFLEREINIHKSLNHPFICKYFTDIETDHLLIIVMEYIEGENLLAYAKKGISLKETRDIFAQLVVALEYLHDKDISHRDLKLENVMIDKFGHIRLIDFGFSSSNTIMTTCCGSLPYCSPEILSDDNYTKSSDIWSLGVILYAIVIGHMPFYHSNVNTLTSIIISFDPPFPQNMNSDARDLIKRMLDKNPKSRITLEDIRNHHFVKDDKFLQISKKVFSPIQKPTETDNKRKTMIHNSSTWNQNSNCLSLNMQINHLQQNRFQVRARRISSSDLKPKVIDDNLNDLIINSYELASNLNILIEVSFDRE